ncbi:2'-5' RNA ligase family protein [Nocardioides sp.]|uniref:2'-5' RNA ligase family protein n=1 Tax=Nocardioides sp. TaxID=35761 RepID=UPI0035676454
MLVFTAIVPPRAALVELIDVVDSVLAVPTATEAPARRGLLGRRRDRSAVTTDVVSSPYDPVRSRARLGDLHLPVAKLGNLTTGDIITVTEALRASLADLPRPTVTFAGGGAIDSDRDKDFWAQLEGDLAELSAIATQINAVAQRHGILVDRRIFHPWLSLTPLTGELTEADQERLLTRLEDFRGQSWTIDGVSLMTPANTSDPEAFKELQHLPLATPGVVGSAGQ